MNNLRLDGLLFLLCLVYFQFGFSNNDIISRKLPQLSASDIDKIANCDIGTKQGFSFISEGVTLGKVLKNAGYSQGAGEDASIYVMGKLPNVVLQIPGYDQLSYILKCKKGKCVLESGLLYLKPTGEVMPLPLRFAINGFRKLISKNDSPSSASSKPKIPANELSGDSYLQAERLYSSNKYSEAIRKYSDYIRENPKGKYVVISYYFIAKCYAHMNDLDKSKETFLKVESDYAGSVWAKFSKENRLKIDSGEKLLN